MIADAASRKGSRKRKQKVYTKVGLKRKIETPPFGECLHLVKVGIRSYEKWSVLDQLSQGLQRGDRRGHAQ